VGLYCQRRLHGFVGRFLESSILFNGGPIVDEYGCFGLWLRHESAINERKVEGKSKDDTSTSAESTIPKQGICRHLHQDVLLSSQGTIVIVHCLSVCDEIGNFRQHFCVPFRCPKRMHWRGFETTFSIIIFRTLWRWWCRQRQTPTRQERQFKLHWNYTALALRLESNCTRPACDCCNRFHSWMSKLLKIPMLVFWDMEYFFVLSLHRNPATLTPSQSLPSRECPSLRLLVLLTTST